MVISAIICASVATNLYSSQRNLNERQIYKLDDKYNAKYNFAHISIYNSTRLQGKDTGRFSNNFCCYVPYEYRTKHIRKTCL